VALRQLFPPEALIIGNGLDLDSLMVVQQTHLEIGIEIGQIGLRQSVIQARLPHIGVEPLKMRHQFRGVEQGAGQAIGQQMFAPSLYISLPTADRHGTVDIVLGRCADEFVGQAGSSDQ